MENCQLSDSDTNQIDSHTNAYELISNHQVDDDGDEPIDLNLEVNYTKKHFYDPRDLDDVNEFNQEYEFEQEQETEI